MAPKQLFPQARDMSSVKITYKEPDNRPIKEVDWYFSWDGGGVGAKAFFTKAGELAISRHDSPVAVFVAQDDALEWARAILKMAEQRHG